MTSQLPLDLMTVAEKLAALDAIWADLTRTPDRIPSPDWHAGILAERQHRPDSAYTDWTTAKQQIRDSLK